MTTQTIFKPHIGVATEKKDQPGWTTDGPSVVRPSNQRKIGMLLICSVPTVCLMPGKADRQVTKRGVWVEFGVSSFWRLLACVANGLAAGICHSLRSKWECPFDLIVDARPVTYHCFSYEKVWSIWHLFAIATSEILRIISY